MGECVGFVLVDALEDADALFFEVIFKLLQFPPFDRDHLLLDLVIDVLMPFKRILCEHTRRARVEPRDEIASHCPLVDIAFEPL